MKHQSEKEFVTYLKSLPLRDRRKAFEVMDRVQLYRNWEVLKQYLPSVPTEPPWVWLAHILTNPEYRTVLRDALPEIHLWSRSLDEMYDNSLLHALAANTPIKVVADKLLALAQSCKGETLIEKLERLGVHKVDWWAKDLWRVVGSIDEFDDFYVEGLYAYRWASSRLKVKFRPLGKQGPDVGVSRYEDSIFVEITRFREDKVIRQKLEEAGRWGQLVDYPITVQQIYDRILGEYPQLIPSEANVLLLHTDNVAKEEIDFMTAVSYIREEIRDDPIRHSRVNAIIFCDRWYAEFDSKKARCYVFVNEHAACSTPRELLETMLEALDVGVKFI